MGTPYLHKLGQKIVIFRGFSKFFSELPTGFQSEFLILIESPKTEHISLETNKKSLGVVLGQNLGQIMSNVVKKVKTSNIIRFFHILLGDYLLKQEAVTVKPPEWKFMAIIARNPKF